MDVKSGVAKVLEWTATEGGIKILNAAGIALEALGTGTALAGKGLRCWSKSNKVNLLISKEVESFDGVFVEEATKYLTSSTRLVNRAEIQGIVREELAAMGAESIADIWKDAKRNV